MTTPDIYMSEVRKQLNNPCADPENSPYPPTLDDYLRYSLVGTAFLPYAI